MSRAVKYIQPVYFPKCDFCNSNIVSPEKYYFVSLEGHDQTDVRIVHRDCYSRNQTHWAREEYENELEDEAE